MKKKVMKKWASRIIFATDFYYVNNDSEKEKIGSRLADKVSAKFIARAMTYPSFKHFMQKEMGINFKPNYKYDSVNHAIYIDRHFDKTTDYHYEGIMASDGTIDMYLIPNKR